MGALPYDLNTYLLRTVDVGVRATYLVLVALIIYLALPGAPDVSVTHYVVYLVMGLLGALLIDFLDWPRLFEGVAGMRMLYLWSVFDIVLISLFLRLTGGVDSPLFILYALTTIFFAASYPPRAQLALLFFTGLCYAAAAWDGDAPLAVGAARMGLLGAVAYLASFLSRELVRSEETVALLREAQMKQTQALEINDNIVQGLVVARYAFDSGLQDMGRGALDDALHAARGLISDLVADDPGEIEPGRFVRETSASPIVQ